MSKETGKLFNSAPNTIEANIEARSNLLDKLASLYNTHSNIKNNPSNILWEGELKCSLKKDDKQIEVFINMANRGFEISLTGIKNIFTINKSESNIEQRNFGTRRVELFWSENFCDTNSRKVNNQDINMYTELVDELLDEKSVSYEFTQLANDFGNSTGFNLDQINPK